jgi:hypothetical protein
MAAGIDLSFAWEGLSSWYGGVDGFFLHGGWH